MSIAQISKIIQSGGLLGSLLSKLAGPLMKVAVPLRKNILAPLGITAAASEIDAGIQEEIHRSRTTTLIISNKGMNDMMKIVEALEDSNILLKGVNKTIKNETKEQKGRFLSMYFRSKFRKSVSRKRNCNSWFWLSFFELLYFVWKRNYRSWLWKRKGFLMPPHTLTNFEIFNFFSRGNLSKK